MGRIIIEYCGGWGYGGPANRLKKAIAEHIPGLEVECISAGKMTSKSRFIGSQVMKKKPSGRTERLSLRKITKKLFIWLSNTCEHKKVQKIGIYR